MTTLALIDYGSGNVRSVRRALESAAADAGLALEVALTADPETVLAADRIVLPGVGHFADCAAGLAARPGLIEAMNEAARLRGRPFLGVCVGMQLLADVGREDANTPGLGWIGGAVERMRPSDSALPVPHMGWNALAPVQAHPVLDGLGPDPHVYFTHSYVFQPDDARSIAAEFSYGGRFVAAIARDSLLGVQFHPEKSQKTGQRLLADFLRWKP